jgi:hypothetical protein
MNGGMEGKGPDQDDSRRSLENLKEMMIEKHGSRWPVIAGFMVLLTALLGAGIWFLLHPEKRPLLGELWARVTSISEAIVNKPIMGTTAPAAPSPAINQAPAAVSTGPIKNAVPSVHPAPAAPGAKSPPSLKKTAPKRRHKAKPAAKRKPLNPTS